MRSPNFGPRRDGLTPTLVVLHYTAMSDCAAAARVLCDPAREVSAHYLIGRDGAVLDLVDEDQRAWHAGKGTWHGQGDVNSRSIGIELDNDGASPFSAPLMAALERLLPQILARWDIPPQGVIGHSDMAPGRKIDPGPRFDWRRLARQGLSIWPDVPDAHATGSSNGQKYPNPTSTTQALSAQFRRDATTFGYGEMEDDLLRDMVRLRFRPWAKGPLDGVDCGIMADLAARFGVDRGGAQG
ncbi:N-acetylmuramoyl-L-alanine amidase [Gymnodinialimonas sp. 2305UL16-5]|uniref:N-acetylmuramoyl-L-alanine amidase n=1 Tax=Gymnodinialimonas mytili TaxID=3126503 RepID=UPI0030AB835F